MHISKKSLEFLKDNPDALGILKAYNPKKKIGYDEIENMNGMFLNYVTDPKLAIFLFRDVTQSQAEEMAIDFEHSLFVPYEVLIQSDDSPMEYIEEWRKRDESCRGLRVKMNTILYNKSFKEEYENQRMSP